MVQSSSGWPKNKDQPANTRLPEPKTVHKIPLKQEVHKYPYPKRFQCFKCQGWGHKSNECPNRRKMILREGILYYLGKEVGLEKEEDETEPQDGEKTGNRPLDDDDDDGEVIYPSQRENLFHTKCLVKGYVCTLVIDSGSCMNVVSVAVVNFLKLPTTLHSPYKLQWLNGCSELKVMRQCVIRFKVGNYQDEVLCDVIPMQACHLLLGRPWQYDRSTKHDGRTNQYSLEKDGQKVTLYPLLPSKVNELHQKMRELKEKGKKPKNSEKEGKTVGGAVGIFGTASMSNGQETW
ncbi:uncharacterized protein LOC124885515 [Capsicum annuum]|uniref:uncharacterized protein LOC124885515 n=1 Tax=Capsicum annuum TaxID=4072 RepID=UPI001FB19216|nr:uncharacterized protein LOC124885515 [Capsicum annuum]